MNRLKELSKPIKEKEQPRFEKNMYRVRNVKNN